LAPTWHVASYSKVKKKDKNFHAVSQGFLKFCKNKEICRLQIQGSSCLNIMTLLSSCTTSVTLVKATSSVISSFLISFGIVRKQIVKTVVSVKECLLIAIPIRKFQPGHLLYHPKIPPGDLNVMRIRPGSHQAKLEKYQQQEYHLYQEYHKHLHQRFYQQNL